MTAPGAGAQRLEPTAVDGRRALVVGLGTFGGGLGAARWLAARGARVTVTDLRDERVLAASVAALAGDGVRLVLGEHREEDFRAAELVVVNPAVPPSSRWLAVARAAGAVLTSEVALFLERVRGNVVAITGTQGKSSTAHMAHQLLLLSGQASHLGGNIGGSLLQALDAIGPEDAVVLELSSYQLEALPRVRSHARVSAVAITNVLADHLERHGDVAAYRAAKLRVLELLGEGGVALLPAGDADLLARARPIAPAERVLAHGPGAGPRGLHVTGGRFRDGAVDLGGVDDLHVSGGFQRWNALVALGLAHRLGARPERLAASLPALRGLPHRMQDLGWRGGVRIVDNGVSTTPDSTAAVLGDVPRGSTLLLGGEAKRLAQAELVRRSAARGVRVFAFGASRRALQQAFATGGVETSGADAFDDAVRAALAATPRGGTLLFSPACASFDAFPNFQARAERFRTLLPSPDARPPTVAPGEPRLQDAPRP